MADFGEADEDFKLPLRTWLERQINAGRFKGLEWLPSDGDTKLFKLPWVKKNSPDWEEYYEVFRAWAKHRGRRELDDSRLKSNFRCALNKSVDFKEINSKSQMHKQTGNFKVYRILSPREVREMKRKSSPVQAKRHLNIDDSLEIKSFEKKGLDILDSMDSSPSMTNCHTTIMQEESCHTLSILPSEDEYPSSFGDTTMGFSMRQLPLTPPEDCYSSLAISPPQQIPRPSWPGDVPMEEEVMEAEPTEKQMLESMSSKSIIIQQLEFAGFMRSQICHCQLIVTYNGEKAFDKELFDMGRGYRLFYGNQKAQEELMRTHNATDDKLANFRYPGISLPEPKKASHTMSAILGKTDLGVVFWFDANTLQVYVKRLCQSQVFYFNPHDPAEDSLPMKLERDEPVCVFSLEKYFTDYLQQVVETSQNVAPPEANLILTVGIKPKCRVGTQSMRGLKIELIPHALKFLMQNMKDQASQMSLCFSNPTSMEYLLRQIQQNSILGTNPVSRLINF